MGSQIGGIGLNFHDHRQQTGAPPVISVPGCASFVPWQTTLFDTTLNHIPIFWFLLIPTNYTPAISPFYHNDLLILSHYIPYTDDSMIN